MILGLIVGLTKKISLYKMSYFPEIKTDLSVYATKYVLKTQQVLIHQNLLKG